MAAICCCWMLVALSTPRPNTSSPRPHTSVPVRRTGHGHATAKSLPTPCVCVCRSVLLRRALAWLCEGTARSGSRASPASGTSRAASAIRYSSVFYTWPPAHTHMYTHIQLSRREGGQGGRGYVGARAFYFLCARVDDADERVGRQPCLELVILGDTRTGGISGRHDRRGHVHAPAGWAEGWGAQLPRPMRRLVRARAQREVRRRGRAGRPQPLPPLHAG
jgi:hypothetical protein